MELISYLNAHYRPRTAHQYQLDILRYHRYLQAQGVDATQGTYNDITGFLSQLRQQGKSSGTVARLLSAVKAYHHWLQEMDYRPDHPCKHVRLRDKVDKRIAHEQLPDYQALEALLDNGLTTYPRGRYRNHLVLSLLVYQALTTQNIVNLQVQDIDLEKATVQVRATSTLAARTLPLHPKQYHPLMRYLAEERPYFLSKATQNHPYLVLTRRGRPETGCVVRKVVEQYRAVDNLSADRHEKIQGLTALKIRQAVLVHLLDSGKDVRIVQTFAGHRQVASTERYQRSQEEALKEAVQAKHPLG